MGQEDSTAWKTWHLLRDRRTGGRTEELGILVVGWYFTSVNVTVLISIFWVSVWTCSSTRRQCQSGRLLSWTRKIIYWWVFFSHRIGCENNFSKILIHATAKKTFAKHSICATSNKVANETSDVRRLALPVGQTAKLYCPKKSFENYPGWHGWTLF